MKYLIPHYCVLLLVVIISSLSFSQEKTSYGVKGGIGVWKFASLQESPNMAPQIQYSYTVGYSLGFYVDNRLSEHFSLDAELLFQNSIIKAQIYTGNEGILDQKITSKIVSIPILIKYKKISPVDIYLFAGPSFAYLVKAEYNYYDQIYISYRGNEEITKEMPNISTNLEFGLGKEIQISSAEINLELRAQWGIVKNEVTNIGKWNNAGLLFLVGYRLN